MTTTTLFPLPSRSRGVTVVEILLVISVLIILLTFAMPGIDRATARAEMKAAAENVQYSIDTARRLARGTESSVVLRAESAGDAGGQRVRLTGPSVGATMGAQDYRLPETIRLVPDGAVFTFDERGLVQNPGKLTLMSLANEAVVSELRVE
jgi:type II secretory pathway pseudopilin PulG